MRVWFRKILCPSFACFLCKPPQHLCTPPNSTPFQSDNNHRHQSPSTSASDPRLTCDKKEEESVVSDGVERKVDDETVTCSELILRSCVKRKAVEEGRKKTVQWMDVAGKDLVDVKEFETSDSEDTDSESEYNRGCICPIF